MTIKYICTQNAFSNSSTLVKNFSDHEFSLDDDSAVLNWLKVSPETFLPCQQISPADLFLKLYANLYSVGAKSISMGISLCMHYYVLASLATYPLPLFSSAAFARKALVRKIKREKLIIANAGSVRTFLDTNERSEIHLKQNGGTLQLCGKAQFMSLSGIADVVLLTAREEDDRLAFVVCDLNSKGVKFGPISDNQTLRESRTRQVIFDGTPVDTRYIFRESQGANAGVFQRTWFQALLPAVYLGATDRLLNKIVDRSATKRSNRRNATLALLDDFRLSAAKCHSNQKLGELIGKRFGSDMLRYANGQVSLDELCEASALVKLFVAEHIAPSLRDLVGFLGVEGVANDEIQAILRQLSFAGAQPMSSFDLYHHYSEAIFYQAETENA
jgi:alkylation response protein AidB-like acyl-CoA dehydrogenase